MPSLKNSLIDATQICGGDLANRIFGARLLKAGFSPYFLPAIDFLSPELIQPNTSFPGLSGTTIAPTFLLLLIPFSTIDYYQLRIIWWALGWILLAGICLLGWCMTKDPPQRFAIILLGLMVADSYFWRLHSERGQYYIFVAFLIALETFCVIQSKNFKGWALGLGIVLRPSLIIALPIVFVVSGWRSAARSLGVFLTFFIASLFLWGTDLWQQYIANSRMWRLCVTHENCLASLEKQWGSTIRSAADTIAGCKTVLGISDKSATFTLPIILDLWESQEFSTIISALMLLGVIALCIYCAYKLRSQSRASAWAFAPLLIVLSDFFLPVRIGYADIIFLPVWIILSHEILSPLERNKFILLIGLGLLSALPLFDSGSMTVYRQIYLVAITISAAIYVYSQSIDQLPSNNPRKY